MIYIFKGKTPQEYAQWYTRYRLIKWKNLKAKAKNRLRNILLLEQGFVCCFCGCKIGKISKQNHILQIKVIPKEHNVRLAHIHPRSSCPCSDLDYTNICASCNTENKIDTHCDIAQGDRKLPISPLHEDCLNHFHFNSILGTVEPHPKLPHKQRQQASQTIAILNLNSADLKNSRLQATEAFEEEFSKAIDGDFVNKKLYAKIYHRLTQKDRKGTFNEFYFIVIANYPYPDSFRNKSQNKTRARGKSENKNKTENSDINKNKSKDNNKDKDKNRNRNKNKSRNKSKNKNESSNKNKNRSRNRSRKKNRSRR